MPLLQVMAMHQVQTLAAAVPGLVAAQHAVLDVVAAEALPANQVADGVEPAQPARQPGRSQL